MQIPVLSETQVAWITDQVAAYIDQQRRLYSSSAVPLTASERTMMQPFFSTRTLDSARLALLSGRRVENPPFYPELIGMGFSPQLLPNFSTMAAITFVDAIISHQPFTPDLLFHELVHVVQYEKLGLREFASKYVKGFLAGGGYNRIPLERNAYELDGRFSRNPANLFSVDQEVQRWIETDRF